MKNAAFSKLLLKWHKEINDRQMPWKGELNPYKVWLSEIILQQTRVAQGTAYYENFIKAFPDIFCLAKAKDEKVYKLWEGLGYYSRCKNMLVTARVIAFENDGKFPESYEGLLQLKGIGPYTAAAISSFCFGLPKPVIDGNVYRVLARIFKIKISPDTTEGKKYFVSVATGLIDQKKPGDYNQAIMDFGATVCKPLLPLCERCIFKKYCGAFLEKNVLAYPVKIKKIIKRERWFTWFVFQHNEKIFIQKRAAKDIWENLCEFYLVETGKPLHWTKPAVRKFLTEKLNVSGAGEIRIHKTAKQTLTHQLIHAVFIEIELSHTVHFQNPNEGKWISREQLTQTSFPVIIRNHLANSIMLS
ncbi:MAG: A/G-specific adenine glycosylase [Chitinophagaceae bacterium]